MNHVIVGNVTSANFGDDLMVSEYISKNDQSNHSFTLIGKNAISAVNALRRSSNFKSKIRGYSWGQLWRVLKCLRCADVVVVPGGTYFGTRYATTARRLRHLLYLCRLATALGIARNRRELLAQGFGDLTPTERTLLHLARPTYVSLRDAQSLVEAKVVFPSTRVAVVSDSGVEHILRLREHLKPPRRWGQPTIVLELSNGQRVEDVARAEFRAYWFAVASQAVEFAQLSRMQVTVLVANGDKASRDAILGQKIVDFCHSRVECDTVSHKAYNFNNILVTLNSAALVVSTRLHVGLAAQALKRPLIAVPYHPKIHLIESNDRTRTISYPRLQAGEFGAIASELVGEL